MVFLLLAVTIPTLLGLFLTRKPAAAWFRRELVPHQLTADRVRFADGYRVHEPAVGCDEVTVPVPVPAEVEHTAAWCRGSFVFGLLSILPVLVGVLVDVEASQPGPGTVLGLSGLLVCFAHGWARKVLVETRTHQAAAVRVIGIGTAVQNAMVVAGVVAANVSPLSRLWSMYTLDRLGVLALLCVVLEVFLVRSLFQAASALQRAGEARPRLETSLLEHALLPAMAEPLPFVDERLEPYAVRHPASR